MTEDRMKRLKVFDELVASSENGILDVGWPTKTWGLITSFDRIHQLFEEIMHRPVWTHEMGTDGLKLMREELEKGKEPLHPIESLRRLAPNKGIIIVTTDDESKSSEKENLKIE